VDRRGSLRWKAFSQIEVRVPELPEQNAIAEVLRDMEEEIAVLEGTLARDDARTSHWEDSTECKPEKATTA
jgi:restriction endonuclease S subunit